MSYNYRTSTGNDVIPDLGHIYLHYPAEDAASGHVNQSEAQLVVGNQIIADDKFAIEFDEATTTITVQNRTGADWPPQTDVVVVVPADLNSEGILGTLNDHELRITALEGAMAGDDEAAAEIAETLKRSAEHRPAKAKAKEKGKK